MTPQRIRLSRRKGFKLPPNTVNVARPSKWGNPFVVGRDGTREECVQKYRAMCFGYFCATSVNFDAQQEAVRYAARNIRQLKGKNIACWCPLPKDGAPDWCHGAVLLALANDIDIGLPPLQLTRIT